MAKITQLPSAASVNDADVFPFVQSGETRQVTASVIRNYAINTLREKLTSARTYYVRNDGSDTNDGRTNTPTGAFATIQRAVNQALSLDCNGYQVTIKINNGTYNENIVVSDGVVGYTLLYIEGNPSSPSSVIINGRIRADFGAAISINGMRLNPANGINCLQAIYFGYIYARNVELQGNGGATQVYSLFHGEIITAGNNKILAGNAYAFAAERLGYIGLGGTWTIGANLTYTTFGFCHNLGNIFNSGATFSLGSYTVTGKRYDVTLNGVIYSAGVGANWLPGTVAGTTATGGQYS